MSAQPFIHLRVHSTYSLSEGAIRIPQLLERCGEQNMPAVALTDTSNVFGAMEFCLNAPKKGVQPIMGSQIQIAWKEDDPRALQARSEGHTSATDELVLFAQNQEGYQNLIKLLSLAWRQIAGDSTEAFITYDDLAKYSSGLIVLSGGAKGSVAKLLSGGKEDAAMAEAAWFLQHFGDRYYIELSRQGDISPRLETALIKIAVDKNIPLVATNEAYFLDASGYEAHDALLCIAGGTYVATQDRRRVSPNHRLKSPGEMWELFKDIPEALENTVRIAQRCAFMVSPLKPVLPSFPCEEGEEVELRNQSFAGLQKRLEAQVYTPDMSEDDRAEVKAKYEARLEEELAIIIKMGFPGYFLIVADFVKWSKEQGIPVGPGRGSGAGSLVAWSLTITDIDPIRFGLIFERFLNPERVSMPDFDIDFCQERRDEVINYVCKRYGHDHVAQIITFGKLQARAVLRDVGRVLQMSYNQVDGICKMIPNNPADPVTLEEALDQDPDLRLMLKQDAAVAKLFEIGQQLEGLYRHASTHAAGVVIGNKPLDETVALYYDPRSPLPVTQFNMKFVELASLVKFDFLGLRTLSVIRKAIELLADANIQVDISTIPLDDEKTFELLRGCETVGVFQLESGGMVDVLRRLKPTRFEELIALVALYRPGPMDDIPRYLACKHGEEDITYLHPDLEGILKETYGVMVYQEQVMHIAQKLAGYSLGAADLLRRAMGKKIKSEMDKQRALFVEGAVEYGVEENIAHQIFDQAAKFAGYGFNKSHSGPYALIAYQTAYMKANHPVEFMAALMTLDMGNTDKLNIFRQELDRMGVPLLPPDVNHSQANFSVDREANGIRYGLAAIKGIGEAAMDSIVCERHNGGSFKDIWDFADRVDAKAINKRQLENLIVAGAFDSMSGNRRQLFEAIEAILNFANTATRERTSKQASLFQLIDTSKALPRANLPDLADWPHMERMQREFDALGFYLTSHPLMNYGKIIHTLGTIKSTEIEDHFAKGNEVAKLAGVILAKNERMSKNGNKFAFLTISDLSGVFEVIVFSDQLMEFRDMLEPGRTVFLTMSGRIDEGSLRTNLIGLLDLDEKISKAPQAIEVEVRDTGAVDELKQLIDKAGRGKGSISLNIGTESHQVKINLGKRFAITQELRDTIHHHKEMDFRLV